MLVRYCYDAIVQVIGNADALVLDVGGTATLALSLLLQCLRPAAATSGNIQKKKENRLICAISLLAITAAIVRAEVALLLVGIVALLFYKESTGPFTPSPSPLSGRYRLTMLAVRTTIIAGLVGAGMSIVVDSYFWSAWLAAGRQHQNPQSSQHTGVLQGDLNAVGFGTRWIWPEAWGLLFNVVEGKSSLWGVSHLPRSERFQTDSRNGQTSPWYAYLLLHLPKLLLASLPLVIVPPLIDSGVGNAVKGWKALLLFPPAVTVLGMSMLGHKVGQSPYSVANHLERWAHPKGLIVYHFGLYAGMEVYYLCCSMVQHISSSDIHTDVS